LWAADRLWVGIVADSPEAWRTGLTLLASGSRTWSGVTRAQAPFANALKRTAQAALRAKVAPPDARAATYGELLSTCAGCHATRE
jgi:mono/diheme cytochrome c family protein